MNVSLTPRLAILYVPQLSQQNVKFMEIYTVEHEFDCMYTYKQFEV